MVKGKPSRIKLPKKPVTADEFRELSRQATESVQQLRAAAQVVAETLAAGRAAFGPEDGTREERLQRTSNSALEFGRTYLSHYFEEESAEFHEALDKLVTGNYTDDDLERWVEELGIEVHKGDPVLNLLAIMIFRGGGKSVIVNLCDHLRRICHGLDPYLIIAGDTYDQAAAQLEDIKDELATNEKIRMDFGNLKPDRGVWQEAELIQRADGRVTWREGRIITNNSVRVDAVGRGSKMRGRRHGSQRPTCFTGDDLDNDENVITKEQRDKAWNWLMSAVIPAMEPKRGNIRIIGTNIHFDCIIARAHRKTDEEGRRFFTSIKFAAMRRADQGQLQSVWPARFSTESLLRKKSLLGATKFGAEYMNDPRDPETQIFDTTRFTYYSPLELIGKQLERILYVDPSKGKKGKGRKKSDFSGFGDILHDRATRITYILDGFRKRLSPNAAKSEVVAWYKQALATHSNAKLWVEENSFGDILGENFQNELRAQGIDRTVNTLLHITEKNARLERHSIRVESGGVRFPIKWAKEDRQPEWFAEYEDFPAGAFDDTIDALESADHIATSQTTPAPDFASSGQKQGSASLSAF